MPANSILKAVLALSVIAAAAFWINSQRHNYLPEYKPSSQNLETVVLDNKPAPGEIVDSDKLFNDR